MERHDLVLKAIATSPNGICICCLVERTGLKHEYLRSLCNELRSDEKLRQIDYDRFERPPFGRRRIVFPKDACGVCGKTYDHGHVYYPLEGSSSPLSESDESSFSWQQLGIAERICEVLPASDRFQCVEAAWLNKQRTNIIKVLNRVDPKNKELKSLSMWATRAREASCLPARIANYIQTLLALRNAATYEDRRLDIAESLIAKVAADELCAWNKMELGNSNAKR